MKRVRFWGLMSLMMISGIIAKGQLTDIMHWETVVFADQMWRYSSGDQVSDTSWRSSEFGDSTWAVGPGGFGYGDGDDNTTIPATNSLYIRTGFNIVDTSKILGAVLHGDYDDGFVAFLNNVEIARANVGFVGDRPTSNVSAHIYIEPEVFQGGNPPPFFIDKEKLSQALRPDSNVLAIQIHNYNINSSDLTSIFYLSLGINDTFFHYSPPPTWFFPPLTVSELPILHIKTYGPRIIDEPRIVADLGVINHGPDSTQLRTDPFNEYFGRISIEIRGSSSQSFPKKGYGFETQDSVGENNNVSLLGMPAENDWILYGPYSDKSLIRNKLTFEIGERVGEGYVPRSRFCELIINNEDKGVYLLIEKIKEDKNRLDIAKVTPNDTTGDQLTGGYILKVDRGTGNPEDEFGSLYHPYPLYVLHDPTGVDLKPVQRDYIKEYVLDFERAMNANSFADTAIGYHKFIDSESFVDYLLVNEIAKDVDAYRLSAFFYKDKDSKGGKLKAGPLWDYNLTFGNYDYCLPDPQGWAYNFATDCGGSVPFYWPKLMTDSTFANLTQCRWQELRAGPLSNDSLVAWVDSMEIALGPAQERHFKRWPILGSYVWPNNFIGNTYEQEMSYLRNWLVNRLTWIDANLPGICTVTNLDNDLLDESAISVFPNPFSESVSWEIKSITRTDLEIEIFDVTGRLIKVLSPEFSEANKVLFKWNARNEKLPNHSIFFFRIIDDRKRVLGSGKLMKNF